MGTLFIVGDEPFKLFALILADLKVLYSELLNRSVLGSCGSAAYHFLCQYILSREDDIESLVDLTENCIAAVEPWSTAGCGINFFNILRSAISELLLGIKASCNDIELASVGIC